MRVNIEVPDVSDALDPSALRDAVAESEVHRASVADIYFEEGDEIEEGELFAELSNWLGTYEIKSPATGTIVDIRCKVGDTVTSEAILASVDTD